MPRMSGSDDACKDEPTLIVGLSTRAIAESAAKGGCHVITLDYFGDRDQKELVQNYSLMRDFQLGFSAEALLQASRQLQFNAVAYVSSLENHPDVVEELAKGHLLLGNTPESLREVRHWPTLRSFCRAAGIPFPATVLYNEAPPERGRWLCKPVKSGGGHGISFWLGKPLDQDHLLQEYIPGTHASAAFVANGRDCVLLGVAEQLIGREQLGARRFTWCGNIVPLTLPPGDWRVLVDALEGMAVKLTRHFGLRGVNGLDFVLAHHQGRPIPYLVEVNPRYTGSMELVEWAYGLSIFDLHRRSFMEELPDFSLPRDVGQPAFHGKGIVYATRDVVMPETAAWRAKDRRDIPCPEEKIGAHHPICTVLAQGTSRDQCWHSLLAAAELVWREVEKPTPNRGKDANVRIHLDHGTHR